MFKIACFNNGLLLVNLIEKGANIDPKNDDEYTPLHNASGNGNLSLIQILIEEGENIEAEDEKQRRPLHFACFNRGFLIVYLIEKGVDIEAKDEKQRTPLRFACEICYDYHDYLLFNITLKKMLRFKHRFIGH